MYYSGDIAKSLGKERGNAQNRANLDSIKEIRIIKDANKIKKQKKLKNMYKLKRFLTLALIFLCVQVFVFLGQYFIGMNMKSAFEFVLLTLVVDIVFIQVYFNYRKRSRKKLYQRSLESFWVGLVTTILEFLIERKRKKFNGKFMEWIVSIGKSKIGRFILHGLFFEEIWKKTHQISFDKKFEKFKKVGVIFFLADTKAMIKIYLPLYIAKLILMFVLDQLTFTELENSLIIGTVFMIICARPISMIVDMVHQKKKDNRLI